MAATVERNTGHRHVVMNYYHARIYFLTFVIIYAARAQGTGKFACTQFEEVNTTFIRDTF